VTVRDRALHVAAILALASPTALAFASGGYFDEARLVALIGAWALVLAAVALGAPLPRRRAAWVALGALAAFTAWVAIAGGWAQLEATARADLERDVLYLGALTAGLINGPRAGFTQPIILGSLGTGALLLVAFAVVEHRTEAPLLPPSLFHSRPFTGANIATVLIYAGLSGVILLLILQLQGNLGYSALRSGASLLPANALMLTLSPLAGRLAHRYGARIPMVTGALIAGAGMLLFSRVAPGASYVTTVLPAVIVFGLGLSALVAPLTAAVLGAAPECDAGVASGVNNAAARLAGLLSAAALPAAAGMGGLERLSGLRLTQGFARAMWICAMLCAVAAVVTWVMVGDVRRKRAHG